VNLISLYQTFSRKERRLFTGAVFIFVVSASLLGISSFYTGTIPEPVEGGSYIEAVVGQPAIVNPLLASENSVDRDLIELLFSDMFDLAESYKESDDHKTWNVKLRENLRWSDGKPITSDDVVFTLGAIQNANLRSPLFSSWQGVIIERLSDQEVRITLRSPYVFFADNLRRLKIVPKHIFSVIPYENLRLSDYNLEPVGSGPYKFSGYAKRKNGFIDEYRLIENPHHVPEPPLIKSITFKFFETKANALDAFINRSVQGLGNLTDNDLKKIKVSHKLFSIRTSQYYAIFLNPTINSILKDESIRLALSYATDKNKLISRVFNNQAIAVDGPLLPFIKGYAPSQTEINFDPVQAREILEKAGWLTPGDTSDGIRFKKSANTATRLTFDLIVPRLPFLIQTANIIKEDWASIGVEIEIIILDPKEIARDVIRTRNYEMILFGNILNNNPDTFSFWHSSQRFYPGLNLSLYENRKVDALLESVRQEFDPEKQGELLLTLQETIRKDQPAVFLFSPFYLYAGPKDLGGPPEETLVIPSDRFKNAGEWYLRTARIFK
jgi:peptide/nickel transport system substrate-binding protein